MRAGIRSGIALAVTLAAVLSVAQVLPEGFSTAGLTWKLTPHTLPGGRVPFVPDPVLEQIAKEPDFTPGWETEVAADKEGRVEHAFTRNGWAAATIPAQAEGTAVLSGTGFSYGFVNGVPFVGDPYSHGYLRVPIALRKGENRLLLRCARGGFSVSLVDAHGSCSLNLRDALVPDMEGRAGEQALCAVVVLNHLSEPLRGAVLEVGDGKVFEKRRVHVPEIVPLGLIKLPFRTALRTRVVEGPLELSVTLRHGKTETTGDLEVGLRKPGQAYRVTRESAIDGSVQYYAVREPTALKRGEKAALFLSLHGAGVEAIGQAGAHYSKEAAYTVAPTNRRPFGHDWQEWGLIDALETLAHFRATHEVDPNRIYLVGHSMGGHGTWYLGAMLPSLWAGIGPSAGWISFFSYGGGAAPKETTGPRAALEIAKLESDTLALIRNLEDVPVFAVHGTADDNVPISEMREMVARLGEFHEDLRVHEEPNAGHWYDTPDHPGAECLDYPPRNEWFGRRVRPAAPTKLSFRTQNPVLSCDHFWLSVVRQEESGKITSVRAELRSDLRQVRMETENAAALTLDFSRCFSLSGGIAVVADGTRLAVADASQPIRLERAGGRWRIVEEHDTARKHPLRGGPFKYGFTRRMVWVYGTHGTAEENAACLAKVRFDQQMWWYRANGNVEVIPDVAFTPAKYRGRNVVLFGHADMNSAFGYLLADCPIAVRRGRVQVGEQRFDGDLSAWLVYPIHGTDADSVVVVGATSALAMRRTFEPRYFTSGVSLPDYAVVGPELLQKGDEAVLAAGYFGGDWSLPKP